MSRKYENNLDTQREYFNAGYFNTTGEQQIAKYETVLLKPFFNNPDEWKLAINRFRVPTSSIPLTANNIPFEQWQVGLGYYDNAQDEIDFSYVPQINPATASIVDDYVISTNERLQKVNSTLNPYIINFDAPINNIKLDVIPTSDGAYNIATFYILDDDNVSIQVWQNQNLITTLTAPTNAGYTLQPPTYITAGTNGWLYYCGLMSPDATPLLTVPYIAQYERTAISSWTQNFLYTTNDPYAENTNIQNVLAYGGEVILYMGEGDGTTYYYIFLSGNSTSVGQGQATGSGGIWTSIVDATYIYRCDGLGNLFYSNTTTVFNTYTDFYVDRFIGFDKNGYLLIHRVESDNITPIGYQSINITNGSIVYSFTPTNGAQRLQQGQPMTVSVDSGPADIFTFQTFINQINLAFQTSYDTIKASLGASYTPTEAPRIIYNGDTKFFSIVVEGAYLTVDSGGTQKFQIFMNTNLWKQFYFPSVKYDLYRQILVQNNGINAVQGTGSSTLPQFLYIQQESSTIYQFNDLTRIIVGTFSIPVSGDGEGTVFTNSGSTNNKSINMITDIIPDTTVQTNIDPIIYVPNGILRWYNLYAQQPFTKIDLIFYYETKDGVIHELNIADGEYFNCKLEFKKGSGDF